MRQLPITTKEEVKCNNIIKTIEKMINFDDVRKGKIKEHDPN